MAAAVEEHNAQRVPPPPHGARGSASLYVGDIPQDLKTPEDVLFNLFSQLGVVLSVKVCRDINSQRPLGYAYVNYQNPTDAERAVRTMNFSEIIPGRRIRIMWSQRDPSMRKSAAGNVFVKNLDDAVDAKALYETFAAYGAILSCKLASDENGKSKGHGFVHFDKQEAADEAIIKVNGTLLCGKELHVCAFKRRMDRDKEAEAVFRNVFVKNIKTGATEDEVKKIVEAFGELESIFVGAPQQHTTQFALVVFKDHESAVNAIESLNDKPHAELGEGDSNLICCRALKKRERQAQKSTSTANLYQNQGRNVYIKHLDDSVEKDQLAEIFGKFGGITSACIMKDTNGTPRGFGFVCFENKESATQAIREMNGKMVSGRPLYVSQAMQRDMRHQLLEEQRRGMMQQQQQRMAMGPMGAYGNYWSNPAAFMGRMPPNPMMPPHMMSFGPMGMRGGLGPRGVPQNRGGFGPRQQGFPGQFPQGYPGMYGQQPPQRYPSQPMPQRPQTTVSGLSAADLSKMSPDEQKNALGERLYAKVGAINEPLAAKITGMLLEMDTPEILNVLEDQNVLRSKVEEAVAVLREHGNVA